MTIREKREVGNVRLVSLVGMATALFPPNAEENVASSVRSPSRRSRLPASAHPRQEGDSDDGSPAVLTQAEAFWTVANE